MAPMDVSYLLDALNPAQREAVTAPPGHYLVLAGAGSGKTRVLTHRIAWLNEVYGVPAHGIFAVTFTNKAAGEMRARADALLQRGIAPGSRGMWIGTFHGLAHRLLRLHWQDARLPEGFQVLDSDDQLRLVKRVVQQLELDEARFPPRQIAWWINAQKDEGRRPQHLQPGADPCGRRHAQRVRGCTRNAATAPGWSTSPNCCCARTNCCATTRRCSRITASASANCWSTNSRTPTRSSTASCACSPATRASVFVVGDDDQAIYGWRGAKVENVQRFLRDYPGAQTLRLEQNYRSTANILGAANAVIAHNPDRLGKQLWTDVRRGRADRPVRRLQRDRRGALRRSSASANGCATAAATARCAILYRSNAQSRAFEEALLAEQIPYRVYGGHALLRARRNQGHAGLPAPGRQPRRRRRVRARGQHADRAASASARWTRCAGARAAIGVSLWEAVDPRSHGELTLARARAQCADGVPRAGRRAGRRKPASCRCKDKIDHVLVRPGLRAHYAAESQAASWIRAPTTSTNWCRSPRASCSATTTRKPRR